MTILQALFLGIVQGITEFLPISSSGHLIFFEHIFNLPVESLLAFDVAVHGGSLLAILWYFRKQWMSFFQETIEDIKTPVQLKNSHLLKLIIGTIPAVIVGLLAKDFIEQYFRGMWTVIILWILVGIGLFLSDKAKDISKKVTHKQSFIIGCVQALAILPGISRSGSTIATGMFLGIQREKAAEFSFFLGAIAIFGAIVLTLLEGATLTSTSTLMIGFLASFVSSLFAVSWLMKILKSKSLKPFAYYLWIVAIIAIIIELV